MKAEEKELDREYRECTGCGVKDIFAAGTTK